MPKFETSTRKIAGRLEREGWVNTGGGSHDIFRRPDPDRSGHYLPGRIVVPRHRDVSSGVARAIAKDAGWN
jgi:predicted RNA binding protein YcfA (HicA-like mRNA interferase family)